MLATGDFLASVVKQFVAIRIFQSVRRVTEACGIIIIIILGSSSEPEIVIFQKRSAFTSQIVHKIIDYLLFHCSFWLLVYYFSSY